MSIPKDPEKLKKHLHELYEKRPIMTIYEGDWVKTQEEAYRKVMDFLREKLNLIPEEP